MNLEYALDIAKRIMNLHPEYALAGSTALILTGILPDRPIHDLDFVCHKAQADLDKLRLYGDYPPTDYGEYSTYQVKGDKGYYYNVFAFNLPPRITTFKGIRIQHMSDILRYKRKYGRHKDMLDLKQSLLRWRAKTRNTNGPE